MAGEFDTVPWSTVGGTAETETVTVPGPVPEARSWFAAAPATTAVPSQPAVAAPLPPVTPDPPAAPVPPVTPNPPVTPDPQSALSARPTLIVPGRLRGPAPAAWPFEAAWEPMPRRRGGNGRRLPLLAVTAVVAALLASAGGVAIRAVGVAGPSGVDERGRPAPSGAGTVAAAPRPATDAQQVGVVDVDVVLGARTRGAGTGMLLTPTGRVLTNRHVVEGARTITVTVTATGRRYAARVVGATTRTDVAVLQLQGASGLATVRTATGRLSIGDPVVGVGNAGGVGGRPSAAPGRVTGLDRTVVATGDAGDAAERLTGLIRTDAAIRPGDSGGPLLDAANAVVGMDTAGAVQGNEGYAIPIATALAAARDILAAASAAGAPGQGESATGGRTEGGRPRLGVQIVDGFAGAQVAGVVPDSPAWQVGLQPGDVIVSVGGRRVTGAADLRAAISAVAARTPVEVVWADRAGARRSATVALAAVPGG